MKTIKVSFIGHRKIDKIEVLRRKLTHLVTCLIEKENADTFLFGSKSQFDDLCLEIVTRLKENFPHIKRIYVRSTDEYISEEYAEYLLTLYDETFFPENLRGAGYRSYVKRNQNMIDMCDALVVYCDKNYNPPIKTKSGTILAVEYAQRKNKRIINLYEQN